MGIAGFLFYLASSSKVEVIPMNRSALDFSNENNSSKPPTGKRSSRKTYLIDDGTCSEQEIGRVLHYVASAKILILTHLSPDMTWTTWRPDGVLIKNAKFDPPWKGLRMAFDYTPVGKTFVVWSQTKLTPRQQGFMTKGQTEDPWTGIADGVAVTFNGVAFPVVNGRKQFWDQEDWGYGFRKPPEFADIPFWVESRVENPGSLAAKVGASLKVGKVMLRLDSFRDPDDEIFATRATISLRPALRSRSLELTPVVDWSEREAKYGKLVKPEDKSRFRITESWLRTNGVTECEVSATTRFKNWKRIDIEETIKFVGYFGHVKTHPNGIRFPVVTYDH